MEKSATRVCGTKGEKVRLLKKIVTELEKDSLSYPYVCKGVIKQ